MPDSDAARPSSTTDLPYLARILETLAEGIVTIDHLGAIGYVNRRGAEILGRRVEAIVGRGAHAVGLGEARDGDVCIEREDGARCWIRVVARPVPDDSGVAISTVV